MPVFGMFIAKRHIRQRFAVIRKQRFALDRPFVATVFLPLLESLPDKIAGRHRYRQRNLRKIRRRRQRKRSRRGCPRYTDFPIAVRQKPLDRFFYPFQRIIVMAVIFLRGRHSKNVHSLFQQPLHGRTRHIIFRIVAEHGDDRAVRRFLILPIRAVKSVCFRIEMNMFHYPPLPFVFS